MLLLWILLTLIATAHEPSGCPGFRLLERSATAGNLSEFQEECLQVLARDSAHSQAVQWVLWRGRWLRDGDLQARDATARALIATAKSPDRTLQAAEWLVEDSPEIATLAFARTEVLSVQWKRLSLRLEHLHRLYQLGARLDPEQGPVRWSQSLTAMGATGEMLQMARKRCEVVASAEVCQKPNAAHSALVNQGLDWKACGNLGHLWLQGLSGSAYVTERDCLVQMVSRLENTPGYRFGAYLAVSLALSRDEDSVSSVALRILAPAIKEDPLMISIAEGIHKKHRDNAGFLWWSSVSSQ